MVLIGNTSGFQPEVAGSNPVRRMKNLANAEWDYMAYNPLVVGSNPTLPITCTFKGR